MIRHNGILSGARYCSNVYFIIHKEYLYIGETGSHPAIRWGSHLQKNGSLRENIRRFDDDIDESEDIFFASFSVSIIDSEHENIRRLARRAVEFEVHRCFYMRSSAFNEDLQIVSRADFPARHSFSFDPASFACAIFDEACQRYGTWKSERVSGSI
ncbi:GIY-YIG nuclease family protein [Methylomonas rosea]|uniref:GIY-YIG domain-containing protein n=1 Tax=Methylomonas rosea TaxID=2952227 RepID=A0ABT1TUJ0_9GAMM|nr:GIY-YIG nuclease family protein [Methylomonas sp. WSC-7]MCQ8118424.1 hypothetical protein [Methylomonas sp. WSC-7]